MMKLVSFSYGAEKNVNFILANLISGAFAQSGGTAINYLYGANDENIVKSVCDGVNTNASRARFGCDSSQDMNGIIADLKSAEPAVLYANAFGPSGFDYQEIAFERRYESLENSCSGEYRFFQNRTYVRDH